MYLSRTIVQIATSLRPHCTLYVHFSCSLLFRFPKILSWPTCLFISAAIDRGSHIDFGTQAGRVTPDTCAQHGALPRKINVEPMYPSASLSLAKL